MMNYEEFKEVVEKSFMDFFPAEKMELRFSKVQKTNRTLDAITLVGGGNTCPTYYINDMYEDYIISKDAAKVIKKTAESLSQVVQNHPAFNLDFENAENQIVFQLVNTKQNEEWLDSLPHRQFHDLSIIYRWVVSDTEDGMASSVITHVLAKKIGLTEEELYEKAYVNTERLYPSVMKSVADIMREILEADGVPEAFITMMISDAKNSPYPLYFLGNENRVHGARALLYDDKLQEAAATLGGDLYVFPSSIHEVLVVNASYGMSLEKMLEMVSDINETELALDERLSNQVYYYDRTQRVLTPMAECPSSIA